MTVENFDLAVEWKNKGNKSFSAGDFNTAIQHFTEAIKHDGNNHVLYSNRSAAYASLKQWDNAINDAEKTVELKNDWAKGYSRLGAALFGAQKLAEAKTAYEKGLQLEPQNAQLQKGLSDVQEAENSASPMSPFSNLFGPKMWEAMASNPQLSPFLAQPDLVEKLKQIQQDPNKLNMYMNDQRIMTIIMGLLGLSNKMPDMEKEDEAPKESWKEPVPHFEPESEPEPVVEKTPEELEKERKEIDFNTEKEKGNAAYKERKWEVALAHYEKAKEIDSTNITIYNNQAAVYFEMGEFEKCIQICEKAVEVGFDNRADFKHIARALGRIGSAYFKMDDLDNAIKYFNKSLAEHRTADVLNKLKEAEKLKVEKTKAAYHNPELAEKEREEGNELFKKHDFAGAVAKYTEAIKRNEKDPKSYSNRAAAYTKLMGYNEAMKDCQKAIELDPTFVKAYIRIAAIEFLKKDYSGCIESCEKAKQYDTENKHTSEIDAQLMKAYMELHGGNQSKEETMKQAMNNPEVQRVLSDPAMQSILQQMQQDPKAVKEHLKNPQVAANIRVLMNAGVLRMA